MSAAAAGGAADTGLGGLVRGADLAPALERSTVAWLDLAESGRAGADLEADAALLRRALAVPRMFIGGRQQ